MNLDELAAKLINERDQNRRLELFHRFVEEKNQKKYAKPVNPVQHSGKVAGRPPEQEPLAAGVEAPDPDSEWRCHICQAVTYYRYGVDHLQWHQDERERLLAVAVEFLGVLGGLKDG